MRADGGAHRSAQDRQLGASVLFTDGRLEPVAIFLAIGGENAYRQCRVEHVVFLEGFDERLEPLLATAIHTHKRKRTGQVVRHLGLDIELAGELRPPAASASRLSIVKKPWI